MTVGFPFEDLTLGADKARSAAGQQWPEGTTHISDHTLRPCLRKLTCNQALQVTHIHKIYHVRATARQINITQQGCYRGPCEQTVNQDRAYQDQAMQSIL